MKTTLSPAFRSTLLFALFLVLLSSLLIATTTLPAQRNNDVMRNWRHDLVRQVIDLERHAARLRAQERALSLDPLYVERLHRATFGSVSSDREVRVP